MAVSPINNVSFRGNYNQVNFEGRKKDRSGHSSSAISNSIKAIPLATLIAMSPLNSMEANAQATTNQRPKTEQKYFPIKVLDTGELPKATPDGRPCKLYLLSTDGDDTTAEELQVQFDYNGTVRRKGANNVFKDYKYVESTVIVADTLEIVNCTEKRANQPDQRYQKYYLKGRGQISYTIPTAADGTPLKDKPSPSKYKAAISQEITKDCYNVLQSVLNDGVQYKTRNEVIDGDALDDVESIIGFEL